MLRLPVPIIEGYEYDNLVIIREVERADDRSRMILCRCSLCSSERSYRLSSLKNGDAKSCGCRKVKHGCSKIGMPEYMIWKKMNDRCNNPRNKKYYLYGAKGVRICERWKDFNKFLEDVGIRPPDKHSLDRYPNTNGDYEPGNVRWATATEQTRNRRSTRTIIYNGKEVPIAELAEQYGLKYMTLYWRLQRGWDIERALNSPLGTKLSIDELLEIDHETM